MAENENPLSMFDALWYAIEKHMGVDPECAHWKEAIRDAIIAGQPCNDCGAVPVTEHSRGCITQIGIPHPRQLLILRNNYATFMKRAQNTTDWNYKDDCIAAANAAALEYSTLTGKSIEDK